MAADPSSRTPAARASAGPKARAPRGFVDRTVAEIKATERLIAAIRASYELYGFEPVETPFVEYADALGKFLPDQDRPNEGVFSFQDDDEQWLSLRYDLTAPLARYVAENFERLPKPYRSYRVGPVFRNEKPGPGRFRQFLQFDADTVGAPGIAADAEICMMAADTFERLGFSAGEYALKVNNRKILDGVMEAIGLEGDGNAVRRLIVLRAIDKFDKFGLEGVSLLLGAGRKDESGDFTKGAGLDDSQIARVLDFVSAGSLEAKDVLAKLATVADTKTGAAGVEELAQLSALVKAAGFGDDRIRLDASVVRGLEYYTGPVFEAELTFTVTDEKGNPVRFGSVGGGGRYDGLVGRFRSEPVPATGFSVGVSRLAAALAVRDGQGAADALGPVVVLLMDREAVAETQALVRMLRGASIASELYLGGSGMKAQMKYADRRRAPCVVIQGSDERANGTVQVKDLIEGARLAAGITDNAEWRAARPAQVTVPVADLVATVAGILDRHR